MLSKYRKVIVAAVGAAASLAVYFGVDNELVQIGVAFATAVGVYAVPNAGLVLDVPPKRDF